MFVRVGIKEIGQHSRLIDVGQSIQIVGIKTHSDGRRVFECMVDGVEHELEWLGVRDHPEGITPFLNSGETP